MIYYVTVECDSFASTNFDHCDGMHHYANDHFYMSDFSFKNFCKFAWHAETIPKKMFWEKHDDAYLLIRVQTMLNHVSICFLIQNQCQKKFFSGRKLKTALHYILCDTSTGLSNRSSTVQITVQCCCIFVLLFGLYLQQLDDKCIYWLSS